jgi:glycosyltransferase involved in cell wall biosynthesis
MKDLISVIIPVYNVKEYLYKCISSVLNQSYSNLEIIIIDDGSTDGSGQLCDSITDERIKVIHKENGGLSSARNAGINISAGKYICFVDSDDYIDVDMVESLYYACEKYSCEISMCGYHIVNSPNPDYCELPNNTKIYSGREALEEMLAGNIKSFAWNKMYRRKLFDEIRFPDGKVYEDIYVMHKLFLKSEKICYIPNCAYYYVWRKGSIMHHYSIKNSYDNYMALKSRLKDIENLQLQNIGGLYADLIRIRLYFEITKWKVPKYEKKKYHQLIKNIDTDFNQIKKSGYESYLSQNEKLKYSILEKSKILYGIIVAGNYDGKRRQVIENAVRKIQRATFYEPERKSEQAIWYIGLPEYNNLGDCAIGYSTQKFILANYPECDLFLVTEKQFYSQWGKIKKYIRETDIIILQGGGNITDLYPDQQMIRKKVLSSFENNKIVIMPQTVYFTKT